MNKVKISIKDGKKSVEIDGKTIQNVGQINLNTRDEQVLDSDRKPTGKTTTRAKVSIHFDADII